MIATILSFYVFKFFSAKYGCYTFMDTIRNKILTLNITQVII